MQSVLDFADGSNHTPKRKRTSRACERCHNYKKKCQFRNGLPCLRCEEDKTSCSFTPGFPVGSAHSESLNGDTIYVQAASNQHLPAGGLGPSNLSTSYADASTPIMRYGNPQPQVATPISLHENSSSGVRSSENRYATMLEMVEGSSNVQEQPSLGSVKLFGTTNPLSALLRQDLKLKIVNNLCTFRVPDPTSSSKRPNLRRPFTRSKWDWEEYYSLSGLHRPQFEYLRSLSCFKLPSSERCGELLEVYFLYIHPTLPIVDRREFLADYYGVGEPPPLILLLGIMLAASRYYQMRCESKSQAAEIRESCDELYRKLRALVDVDVTAKRVAVLQATLLASLHWEGREGVNSAMDALSLAVRIAQEMGLHRNHEPNQDHWQPAFLSSSALSRRIWWCTYAMDRFYAAADGTPFLINELDCDAKPLNENDFIGEDEITQRITMLNVELATIVQDAVRQLYSPRVQPSILYTRTGENQRDDLGARLDSLHIRIHNELDINEDNFPNLWRSLLLVHLNAVRILVHRPFLVHYEFINGEEGCYKSRDLCRAWTEEIVNTLDQVREQGLLCYSWPFTVYAIVNAMLILWYDVAATENVLQDTRARGRFVTVIELLRFMGNTWWAAAAKNKLAEALLRIADRMSRRISVEHSNLQKSMELSHGMDECGLEPSIPDDSTMENLLPMSTDSGVGAEVDADFWSQIGLDFDSEVVPGVFRII